MVIKLVTSKDYFLVFIKINTFGMTASCVLQPISENLSDSDPQNLGLVVQAIYDRDPRVKCPLYHVTKYNV